MSGLAALTTLTNRPNAFTFPQAFEEAEQSEIRRTIAMKWIIDLYSEVAH